MVDVSWYVFISASTLDKYSVSKEFPKTDRVVGDYFLVDTKIFNLVHKLLLEWLNGLRNAKMCRRAYANSEGPDQTAHSRSLIRAFAVR